MPKKGYKQTEEHRKKIKNKIPWNKGKKGLQIPWNKGKKGCQIGYNKGINKVLSESYQKWLDDGCPKIHCKCPCHGEITIKEHHKWYGIPEYIPGHHSKVNNPFKDKQHTEITKSKISNANKGMVSINKGKHFSDISRKRMSDSAMNKHNLEKNPAWMGGISYLPYCFKFNNTLKEEIRNRDNRICQECGKTELDNHQKLSVHHVHYDKENCYPDLISLCVSCNFKVNTHRDYWEEHFMEKLRKRNLLKEDKLK